MAHSITVTKLLPGNYRTIFHVKMVSDGSSAELTDYVLVDPADVGLTSDARLAIESIEYNFTGFDASIEFDSGLTNDNLMWNLSRDLSCHDFMPYGGIKDPSSLDGTGKIQINTNGFSDVGSIGTMVIKVRNG